MKPEPSPSSFREQVYDLVQQVPTGRVCAYSDLAAALGNPGLARQVGFALAGLPESLQDQVPWQRVINVAGKISGRGDSYRALLQEQILRDEGLQFSAEGKVANWRVLRFQSFTMPA